MLTEITEDVIQPYFAYTCGTHFIQLPESGTTFQNSYWLQCLTGYPIENLSSKPTAIKMAVMGIKEVRIVMALAIKKIKKISK